MFPTVTEADLLDEELTPTLPIKDNLEVFYLPIKFI